MSRTARFIAAGALSLLSSCAYLADLTPQQQANLQLELTLAEQIGTDVVSVWCTASGVVYVIANDASAQSRVTRVLAKNAQAATDACPMISAITGVRVLTSVQARSAGVAK